MPPIVQVQNLKKTYSSVNAVDNLSFEIEEGEIFGMVGPNVAGMSLEILPEGIQKISAFLPLTYVVKLLRGLWFGQPLSELWLPVVVLGVMMLVLGLLASRLFKWT